MSAHGTTACYYAGCRCDDCRAAKRDRVAANRAKAKARGFAGLKHGARSAYDAGCRCRPCRRARAEINRREYVPRPGPARRRGTCAECGHQFGVLIGGFVRIHGLAGEECPGSHYIAMEFRQRPTRKKAAA